MILSAVNQFLQDAGATHLALYGSAALSVVSDQPVPHTSDFDVALIGGECEAGEIKARLIKRGYMVTTWLRRFQMNRQDIAWIFEAKGNGLVFDVTLVCSFEVLGQFSIEKLRIEMPSKVVFDCGASQAIRDRLLQIAIPAKVAIPYLLLGRMLVLGAQHDLPLGARSKNATVVQEVLGMCQGLQVLAGEELVRASALSAVFRSILRARPRRRFLEMISRLKAVEPLSPTLAQVLASASLRGDPRLNACMRKQDLAALILQHSECIDAKILSQEMNVLSLRTWSETDVSIARLFDKQ